MHQECIINYSTGGGHLMENFWTLMGFGFALLCLAVVVAIAGILGYIVHITIAKNKKIEVAPAKVNSNQTTQE